MRRLIALSVSLVLSPAWLLAKNAGTEAASFLEIPVGASPAAMGSAYSALASDAYAPIWNPAGLGVLQQTQLAGQHLSYLENLKYEFASAVFPLGSRSGIGVSAQYLGTGNLTERDENGIETGEFSNAYAAYTAAYGLAFSPSLSLGLSGKWIRAQLADVNANALAMDVGALWNPTSRLSLAGVLANIGTPLKFIESKDDLPRQARLGLVYRPSEHWTFATEGTYGLLNQNMTGHLGVEWQPIDLLSVRTGYGTDHLEGLSPLAGLRVGFGLHLWGHEVSYAWVPYGDLGSAQYLSVQLTFGRARNENKARREEMSMLRNEARSQTTKDSARKSPSKARSYGYSNPDDAMFELLEMDSKKGRTTR